MFDYTRAAGRKIKQDIDSIALGLNITTQIFSIVYLIYLLICGSGLFAVKLILLLIASGYFAFFCIATAYSMKKQLKRKVALTFQWSRRAIKLVNLGIIIYGFANAEHTSFSLLLIAFSILSWALDLVIGVISFILTSWLQLFFTGIETDMEEFKKTVTAPFAATGNFFKRMAGKEIVEEEKPEPTAKQKILFDMVSEERETRANKRMEMAQERLERMAQAKQERKAQKALLKEEKRAKKQEKKQAKKSSTIEEESAISKE